MCKLKKARIPFITTFVNNIKMNFFAKIMLPCLLIFLPVDSLSSDTKGVVFVNNSEKLLKCWIKTGSEYTPFIRLESGNSKSFEGFKIGADVRCSTEVDKKQGSTTMLTYFSVKSEGIYELLQERVPCATCPSKVRWATIVTFPNGEAFYTKWKE